MSIDTSRRTRVIYYAVGAASGATGTETAITLTRSAGSAATSTAVSFAPAAGVKFRIQTMAFASRGHNTGTAQITTFALRLNTAGAVITSSTPLIFSARTATAAVSLDWDRVTFDIQDGMEIVGDGTMQWGLTANAVFTTNAPTWDAYIIGYEYA